MRGVCKTRTGYLRMADAGGKIRMEKKNAHSRKSKEKKKRNADGKKNNKINKQTNKKQTKERNLSFKSLSHRWTLYLNTERDANS